MPGDLRMPVQMSKSSYVKKPDVTKVPDFCVSFSIDRVLFTYSKIHLIPKYKQDRSQEELCTAPLPHIQNLGIKSEEST